MKQPLKKRLSQLINILQEGFIERDMAIRLALLSLLAGEHLILIGAPGTAKSELARRLHFVLKEGDYFERLLTKFSVPEELFGPLSIKSLEQDRYHRLTKNYLPSATIAFVDEVFKANSAILNSLLTLLNEREFDNGEHREKVPLLSVIGASNELPEEGELAALYDRFLCRYEVKPVSDQQFLALLSLSDNEKTLPESTLKLDLDELDSITQQAMFITIPEAVLHLLQSLRMFLSQQKVQVSDRRWRKVIKLLQVSAYTNGQESVSIWDCFLLQHCLWELPQQKNIISNWYQSHLGIGSGFNHERLEKLVLTWESTLQEEQSRKVHLKNKLGDLLYTNRQGQETTRKEELAPVERDGQSLYLAPPDNDDRTNNDYGYTLKELKDHFFDDYYQQCHIDGQWQHIDNYIEQSENRFNKLLKNKPQYEPAQYAQSFIDKRVRETQTLYHDLNQFAQSLKEQSESTPEVLTEHLWVTADFIEQAKLSLAKTLTSVESLKTRVAQLIDGFKQLPLEQPVLTSDLSS